jgi:hypothetical protein
MQSEIIGGGHGASRSAHLRAEFGVCTFLRSHVLPSLRDSVGSVLGIHARGAQRIRTEWQGTVGHGQVIHDLVVEGVAVSGQRDLRRIMVQSNRVGEHSVVRHLSSRSGRKVKEINHE